MNFVIKIEYCTGDSFNSYDTSTYLEGSWGNLDKAKDNLVRIRDHYHYYRNVEKASYVFKEDKVDKPSFWDDKHPESITLKLDNGNDWKFTAFWCGCFEHLNAAGIEIDPKDMRIEF